MDIRKWTIKYSTDSRMKYNSESTLKNYNSCVSKFLERFSMYREPKEIPTQDIKQYLLTFHTLNTRKHQICAIKSFYRITVGMPNKIDKIEYPRKEYVLPKVIGKEFLIDKISKIENIKHKAIISLAFSTGLRVSEVVNLKIKDIDSDRMIIHVKQAKGSKDRIVPLSENILSLLREYFTQCKPVVYLFNGQNSEMYSPASCNAIVKKYIGNEYHFHSLRHSCFTALLESGTDLRIIQKIAGHNSSKTTEIYTHVSRSTLSMVQLPI